MNNKNYLINTSTEEEMNECKRKIEERVKAWDNISFYYKPQKDENKFPKELEEARKKYNEAVHRLDNLSYYKK